MLDEHGEPTDAQYLDWNEANDHHDSLDQGDGYRAAYGDADEYDVADLREQRDAESPEEECPHRCGYVDSGRGLLDHVKYEHTTCTECGSEPAAPYYPVTHRDSCPRLRDDYRYPSDRAPRPTAGIRDTAGRPLDRDAYADRLRTTMGVGVRRGAGVSLTGDEASVAAELLDELSAVYRGEPLGSLARELAMRIYDRLGL